MASPPSYNEAISDNGDIFVTLPDCQAHASLLHTFYQLRISDPEVEKVYLARAEARYFQWMDHVQSYGPSMELLPPIDIVYMWHAHLLSPYRYYEDTLRNGWVLFHTKAYGLPLQRLEWAKTTFEDGVDPESEQYWRKFFPDQPYKLTTDNVDAGFSWIACPCCQSRIRSSWVDYAKMRTDKHSSIPCHNCKAKVTAEALSCARFVKDWSESTKTDIKLAGFQLDKKGKRLYLQPEIAARMIAIRDSAKVQAVLNSKEPLDWIELVIALRSQITIGRTDSKRLDLNTVATTMRSRYMGIPYKSSLDIIIAVARQWEFTAKMVEINWTTPASVADAVARYKKFLMLMKDHPKSILVPVLSIDLAWHTHMLNHYNYREYTLKHLFLVVNHDDTIASSKLNNYLISTAKLWYQKYQEPYTSDNLEKLYSSSSMFAAIQKRKMRKYWYQDKTTEKKEPTMEKDRYVEHNTGK
ncbi:hypothetical protein K450DRAFT_223977 [Umbelopsis ramanniana AG]|uniref:Uncharacterized protein n=1 Tax=Umbelopsis ramanniana AG TaxID=1314678 RepID=A0AAD5HI96_UMBRA|nr:uncharacterized protein K450DRAFT_223977 [Umbelopsis ramanniana AG]KAI8583053.1 hypothetical protein K450DRAFT_223977 [Umbelopsis ramanniana AG]